MTNEELLQHRYEVIVSYPNSEFYVGDIIEEGVNGFCKKIRSLKGGSAMYNMVMFEIHPQIFRKLEWWEKRDIKDMPEYVKCIYGETSLDYQQVYKSISWGLFKDEGRNFGNEGDPFANIEILHDTRTHDKGEIVTIHAKWLFPATKDEYLIQNNPKKVEI